MAHQALYGAERGGARVVQFGRVGLDAAGDDLGSHTYTGTLRTERVYPVGPGGLVNFRRVLVNILSDGTYTFTVKVWVDDSRTTLGDATTQTVSVTGGTGSLAEITEEISISAEGSHIQVEITVDSNNTTGVFLIESIVALGRAVRRGATRSGESS